MPAGSPSTYTQDISDRFWSKVDKSGDCWEWKACKDTSGYGIFRFNGRQRGAHRVALMLSGVIIPPGMQALHHCDNRSCVHPKHLFFGTNADNMSDRNAKQRQAKGEQIHCGRLTEPQAKWILANKGTMTQRAMAAIFGVEHATIGCIWRRTTWKYLSSEINCLE